jgi:hypothetical protein
MEVGLTFFYDEEQVSSAFASLLERQLQQKKGQVVGARVNYLRHQRKM